MLDTNKISNVAGKVIFPFAQASFSITGPIRRAIIEEGEFGQMLIMGTIFPLLKNGHKSGSIKHHDGTITVTFDPSGTPCNNFVNCFHN